jgi:hypothetical protein
MALSQSVEDSLQEAQSSLRNALAFAARQEEPYVAMHISQIIMKIDGLIKTDKFFDKIEDMLKDHDRP